MEPADTYECDGCERAVDSEEVIRSEPMGTLDPAKWQNFCCPDCGRRLRTVFVALEE